MLTDVFISYARDELAAAERVKAAMEQFNLQAFFDLDGGIHAGDSFPERITEAVRDSKIVLGCWSPAALQRPWVRRECLMARDLNKLVPVALEPLTSRDLPAEFYDVSYVDLSTYDWDSDHLGWSQTLAAIAAKLDLWANENPTHPDSERVLDKAGALRRESLDIRRRLATTKPVPDTKTEPDPQVPTPEQWSGASRIWQDLSSGWIATDLQRFIDSFPGTPEAYEARKRLDLVKEADKQLKYRDGMSAMDIQKFLSKFPDHPSAEALRKSLPRKQFTGEWAGGAAGLAGAATFFIHRDNLSGEIWVIIGIAAAFGAFLGWIAGHIVFSFKK